MALGLRHVDLTETLTESYKALSSNFFGGLFSLPSLPSPSAFAAPEGAAMQTPTVQRKKVVPEGSGKKIYGGKSGGTRGTSSKLAGALSGVLGSARSSIPQKSPYSIGQKVEYNSVTNNRWVPAVVRRVNLDGTLDLDIKTKAETSNVRPRRGGLGGAGGLLKGLFKPSVSNYQPGESVEYRSKTNNEWVPARVVRVNAEEGTVDLDIKPMADPKSIRKVSTKASSKFSPGQRVQYRSNSNQGQWVDATVKRVNDDGTVDIDLRPRADPSNLRTL